MSNKVILIKQTTFGDGKGNCWAACFASILEIPLDQVPNFCGDENYQEFWWSEAKEFLSCFGLTLIEINPSPELDWDEYFDCYWVAIGKSPRGDFHHAVVYHGSEMAHDPHPSGAGLDGPVITGGFLLCKDPARFLRQTRTYVPLKDK